MTSGEQQHVRRRGQTFGGADRSKMATRSDSARQMEACTDSGYMGTAVTMLSPAFLAALIATWSCKRHSNGTAASTIVATSMAVAPVAVGAAYGLSHVWQRCVSESGLVGALWNNACDVVTPRMKQAAMTPSFVVLCQMGIEDIVEEEIVSRLEHVGIHRDTSRSLILRQDIRGLVMVVSGGGQTETALLGLRTANYVLSYNCS